MPTPRGSDVQPAARDRVPPYSEEAERGVLGSILLESERVVDLCIEGGIVPEAFYVGSHRALYEVLVEMHRRREPVDIVTLKEKLEGLGQLDELGGIPFLEALMDGTPTTAHAEYYVTLVQQKYVLRSLIQRSREAIEACYNPDQEAEEILGNAEQSILEIAKLQRNTLVEWPDLVKASMEEIESIYQQKKGITGVPSGFLNLDDKLLGLQPGDMVIIAARPSMGKTSLALNMAEHIALGQTSDKTPRPVAVFSLEMSKEQLVRRMICSHARVSSHSLAKGFVSTVNHGLLMQAADALSKARIVLDDTPGLSVLELRSRARRLKRKYDVELIVIDYLQLLNYPKYAAEGRQREVAAISGMVKAMAKELSIPVVVLSQLSRAPETRGNLAIPKLSDLRDSGSIEQDADVVGLLRRPSRYPEDPDHEDRLLAKLDIAKHRNGPVGEVLLNFEEDFMRFEDRAGGMDDDMAYEPAIEGENT